MRAPTLTLGLLLPLTVLGSSFAQDAAEIPPGSVNPNPLSSLQLEDLTATRSFPLFTPSRTAPVVAETVPEAEPAAIEEPVVDPEQPPPPLQLVGIVLTDATQTALLLDSASQEVHRLSTGDEYEGWSLTIIDSRSVEFRSGDRVEGLKMFESFPSPPTTSAVSDFPGIDVPPDGISGGIQPDMMTMPDAGVEPRSEQPADSAEPIPEDSPVDFDPALGTVPMPEEGQPPSDTINNGNSG